MSFDREVIERAGADGLDEAQGDAAHFLVAADHFLDQGQPQVALSALDRAYGLRPEDPDIAALRRELLERQTIIEHGLVFRYVPAGSFLQGSTTGDPDERPVHPVRLAEFWIAAVPLTWSAYCALMDWEPPPRAAPRDVSGDPDWEERRFYLHQANKIRLQYCESHTREARDWHSHDPLPGWRAGDGPLQTGAELFGAPDRDDPSRPWTYDRKPMVAVGWPEAEALAQRLSTAAVIYELPSESQWEKAARGGLIGQPYPWGAAPPDPSRCDFDHFGTYAIADPRRFAANGYGLHGMAGGVWEWTATTYDALGYRQPEQSSPDLSILGDEPPRRVLRGGSWADSAAAVTVSFRHALVGESWRRGWTDSFNPNVGVRLIRRAR